MKKQIISAILGGTFYGVMTIGLGFPTIVSVPIAIAAYGAGNLVLSDKKKYVLNDSGKNLYEILKESKNVNENILLTLKQIEDKELVENGKEIYDTTNKIIDTVSKKPEKLKQVSSFFNYYLPVTLKILVKYDEIENQKLESENGKEFMNSVKETILNTNTAFKSQLSNLYSSDIIDTDAEIKVLDTMLKTEGYTDINEFKMK